MTLPPSSLHNHPLLISLPASCVIFHTNIADIQDARLAEALVNFQLRLLSAMDGINDRIERGNQPHEEDIKRQSNEGTKTGTAQVAAMDRNLQGLEDEDKKLQSELDAVQAEFEAMSERLKKVIVSQSVNHFS